MTLWLKVTHDKYEFPLAIADSPKQLAEMVGTTKAAVVSGACHFRHGRAWSCYRKVEIEDEPTNCD